MPRSPATAPDDAPIRFDDPEPVVLVADGGYQRPVQLLAIDPLRVAGEVLVWVGTLMILFALFQLWGTGLLEWRAQRALDAEFAAARASAEPERLPSRTATDPGPTEARTAASSIRPVEADTERPSPPPATASSTTGAGDGPTSSVAAAPAATSDRPPPAEGEAIGRLHIPAIGLIKTIVEGVDRETLRSAPGHYPTTAMPGRSGNAAIAGHRTTHGAPFGDLDRLVPGDHIEVETVDGFFTYVVDAHPGPGGEPIGHFIVDPSEVGVIGGHGDDRLTLTACHPRYSARQRIIVTASLIGPPADVAPPALDAATPPPPDPVPAPPAPAEPPSVDAATPQTAPDPIPSHDAATPQTTPDPIPPLVEGGATIGADEDLLDEALGWQWHELDPTLLWATTTVVILHAGWILGRLWRRRWTARLLTAPAAAAPLFLCFIHLDRLLPAL